MEGFTPFGIAKTLKEKGFKEQCLSYYTKDGEFRYNDCYGRNVDCAFKSFNSRPKHLCSYRIDAPTIPQVLKWLREEKEIDIVIEPIDANTVFMGGEKYILSIYINRKRYYKIHRDNIDKYVQWEEAAIAGIKHVFDILI